MVANTIWRIRRMDILMKHNCSPKNSVKSNLDFPCISTDQFESSHSILQPPHSIDSSSFTCATTPSRNSKSVPDWRIHPSRPPLHTKVRNPDLKFLRPEALIHTTSPHCRRSVSTCPAPSQPRRRELSSQSDTDRQIFPKSHWFNFRWDDV